MAARARSARNSRKSRQLAPQQGEVQGDTLEPIRVVERELTRPDGTKLRVSVPVYPPFRLKERPAAKVRREAERKAS